MVGRSSRMTREARTVEAMIRLYCQARHKTNGPICPDCRELWEYSQTRLNRCPFQEGKTTCAKCPVHCYRPELRERIRTVMRYAGPRMLLRHPFLALMHLWDGIRRAPGD